MKLGLCTIAFEEEPVDFAIRLAAQVGFEGVEIWGKAHLPLEAADAEVGRIAQLARDKGLEIPVYGSYVRFGLVDKPAAEVEVETARALHISKLLGAPFLRVWMGSKGTDAMTAGDWGKAVSDLRLASRLASDAGITLILEMHDNCYTDTAEATLRLMQEVASEHVKANFQVCFGAGADDPWESFQTVKDYIANVHVQNRVERKIVRLQEGDVDYRPIIQALRDSWFNGFLEIEFVRAPKVESLISDYRYLRSLLA